MSLASSENYLCQTKGKNPASHARRGEKKQNFLIIR
jgi:hypothetical protein